MVIRKISKKIYLKALIITIFIFILGLILGIFLSGERAKTIGEFSRVQKLDYDSIQLQFLYLGTLEEQNCLAVMKTLEENINTLNNVRVKLEDYITQSVRDNSEFTLLKREYVLAEIRYWLLAQRSKELCDIDTVSIFYFYSNEDCQNCKIQGTILTYLKDIFEEKLLVFSLDADFDKEPIIDILKSAYDIKETPTLIVENRKFEGLITRDELLGVICPYYKTKVKGCENVR
ncbi:hypothetical protein CL621_01760 [archaeon]|nr:hypothetical protein [archaeon]